MERKKITIEVEPNVMVLYARILEMNIEGLIDFAKDSVGLTQEGAKEFEHITTEIFNKSLESSGIESVLKEGRK